MVCAQTKTCWMGEEGMGRRKDRINKKEREDRSLRNCGASSVHNSARKPLYFGSILKALHVN